MPLPYTIMRPCPEGAECIKLSLARWAADSNATSQQPQTCAAFSREACKSEAPSLRVNHGRRLLPVSTRSDAGPGGRREREGHNEAASLSAACAVSGFDAASALSRELAVRGRTSLRRLIVGAGEGTSGTSSLARVLVEHFRLRVMHADSSPLAWETLARMASVEPSEYGGIDFVRLLEPFDAVLDTPVAQLFPFILAAFPRARVLHTVRDAHDWVAHRSEFRGTPKPFAAWLAKLNDIPPKPYTWATRVRHWKDGASSGSGGGGGGGGGPVAAVLAAARRATAGRSRCGGCPKAPPIMRWRSLTARRTSTTGASHHHRST